MSNRIQSTACGLTVLALAAFAVASRGQDPAKLDRPPTVSERSRAIEAEWDAATKTCWAEARKAKTEAEQQAIIARLYPDELVYYRRCLELADSAPTDPGAREAWLWVVTDGMRNNDSIGPRSALIGRAVEGLLRHHADDPGVAGSALDIDNVPSQHRAALTRGLYQKAKSHKTRGLAAVALAQYLAIESELVAEAKEFPIQPNVQYEEKDEQGRARMKDGGKQYDDVYYEQLKTQNEAAMRVEVEGLFQLVIAEFADVPLNPWHYEGDSLVKNPHPKSLADHARARLDDIQGLAIDTPAPEIEGVDLDGKPLKLSDYRGKVVAVTFWNSGCGPCLASVAGELALLEKLKGKPFAILGVNTDEKVEAGLKAARETKMTWPSWRDGREGPLLDRYHVRGFPTTFVIGPDGLILEKHAEGETLGPIVEAALALMEAEAASKPGGSK